MTTKTQVTYTPGPWTVGFYETTPTMRRLMEKPQSCVCLPRRGKPDDMMVIALCGHATDEESQKNADLIAAAPELLVAAKRVIFPNGGRDYTDGKEALAKAIFRAEGRTACGEERP